VLFSDLNDLAGLYIFTSSYKYNGASCFNALNIQNTAARVVTRRKKHDHITPTRETLHWLPIHYRVQYKVLLYVFKALKQEAPLYLEELVNIYKPARSLRSESLKMYTVTI
jgi:hypothetical protein